MKSRAQTLRDTLVAKAHMAPKDLGLSDAERRETMMNLFGVDSCKHLSTRQLDELIRHFEARGWEAKEKKAVRAGRGAKEPAMLAKVEALLTELAAEKGDWHPWNYATAILKKMYGVEKLQWANAKQLRGVIAALYKHLERRRLANLEPDVIKAEQEAFKRCFPRFKQTAGGRA